jgi:hypothetical protein
VNAVPQPDYGIISTAANQLVDLIEYTSGRPHHADRAELIRAMHGQEVGDIARAARTSELEMNWLFMVLLSPRDDLYEWCPELAWTATWIQEAVYPESILGPVGDPPFGFESARVAGPSGANRRTTMLPE